MLIRVVAFALPLVITPVVAQEPTQVFREQWMACLLLQALDTPSPKQPIAVEMVFQACSTEESAFVSASIASGVTANVVIPTVNVFKLRVKNAIMANDYSWFR